MSALFCLYCFFAVSASDLQADAGEEGAWGGGAIDVARIAVHTLVQVALEMVEQVLHTRVHLQRIVLIQWDIVAELQVPLEENRCLYLLVLLYITREVLHQHAARELAVGHDMEVLDWLDIAEEIAIVVRRAEHAALWCDIGVLTPLLRLDITAVVVGITRLEREQVTKAHLGFDIHSRYARAARVGAR